MVNCLSVRNQNLPKRWPAVSEHPLPDSFLGNGWSQILRRRPRINSRDHNPSQREHSLAFTGHLFLPFGLVSLTLIQVTYNMNANIFLYMCFCFLQFPLNLILIFKFKVSPWPTTYVNPTLSLLYPAESSVNTKRPGNSSSLTQDLFSKAVSKVQGFQSPLPDLGHLKVPLSFSKA